jgi:pyruvate formate lyase activating enzyme
MQRAMLWQRERNGVRCFLCPRNCFIAKGKSGYCLVRVNKDNELYTLNYEKIFSVNVSPIERNHLFHLLPRTKTLSLSVIGCNLGPPLFCRAISKGKLPKKLGESYEAEKIIEMAIKRGCSSITYAGEEPVLYLEFCIRAAKLAERENLKNIFVSSGYMGYEAIKRMKYLDGAVINFLASGNPGFYKRFMDVPDIDPIYYVLGKMKKRRIFMEITNLVIPQLGDSLDDCRDLTHWIVKELGSETPFHLLRFKGGQELPQLPPTPVEILEEMANIARSSGLRYVYIENVPGHPDQSSYCYNCRELLIKRDGLLVGKLKLVDGRCPNCGFKMNFIT